MGCHRLWLVAGVGAALLAQDALADGPYQITFANHAWAQVQLQITTGNFQDCSQNHSEGPYILPLNVGHVLSTSATVVCYRRTADPTNPNSGWGSWNSISPNDQNTPMTIELN